MVRIRLDRRKFDAISIQRSRRSRAARHAPRNGFDVTDAVCNTRSTIRRVSEHHMVPAEVCDGQDSARSTLCGRDIDTTLPLQAAGYLL